MFACADSPGGTIGIDPENREIELSGTNPRTVHFTASGPWYVRIDYIQGDTKWLNVSPLTGEEGSHTLTITAKSQNYTGQDRKALLVIKLPANDAEVVTVIQPAVPKPRFLSSLTRSVSGTNLQGPTHISFEYNEAGEKVSAFSAGTGSQTARYELKQSGSAGSIDITPAPEEGNRIPLKFIADRISSTGLMGWDFRDRYTGNLLQSSTVMFEFTYDNSDDKLLTQIKRTESLITRNGETLSAPLNIVETYEYRYTTIRIDSLIHIKSYTDTSKEPVTEVSDTVKYALKYAENYEDIEDNNMTADIWNLLVFPQFQGEPFYTLTGYWLLGLTGSMQNNLPQEVTVERRIHSPEGMNEEWPARYIYTYQRNAAHEIDDAYTAIEYGTVTDRVTMAFTYSDTIPGGQTDEEER